MSSREKVPHKLRLTNDEKTETLNRFNIFKTYLTKRDEDAGSRYLPANQQVIG